MSPRNRASTDPTDRRASAVATIAVFCCLGLIAAGIDLSSRAAAAGAARPMGGAIKGPPPSGVGDPEAGAPVSPCLVYPNLEPYQFCYAEVAFDASKAPAGALVEMGVHRPSLAPGELHTLAEIALSEGVHPHRDVVEIGWRVDESGGEPHLFVFYWVDGAAQCYNNPPDSGLPGECVCPDCVNRFVPIPNIGGIYAGMSLGHAVDESKLFSIEHVGTGWWLAYDGIVFGHYPDEIWERDFKAADTLHAYGEVAAPAGPLVASEMGNGLFGSFGNDSAQMSVYLIDASGDLQTVDFAKGSRVEPPHREWYDLMWHVGRIRYGGPGWLE